MGRSTRHELYGIAAKLDNAHVACIDGRTDLWVNTEDLGQAVDMVDGSLGGRYQRIFSSGDSKRRAIVVKDS